MLYSHLLHQVSCIRQIEVMVLTIEAVVSREDNAAAVWDVNASVRLGVASD